MYMESPGFGSAHTHLGPVAVQGAILYIASWTGVLWKLKKAPVAKQESKIMALQPGHITQTHAHTRTILLTGSRESSVHHQTGYQLWYRPSTWSLQRACTTSSVTFESPLSLTLTSAEVLVELYSTKKCKARGTSWLINTCHSSIMGIRSNTYRNSVSTSAHP